MCSHNIFDAGQPIGGGVTADALVVYAVGLAILVEEGLQVLRIRVFDNTGREAIAKGHNHGSVIGLSAAGTGIGRRTSSGVRTRCAGAGSYVTRLVSTPAAEDAKG